MSDYTDSGFDSFLSRSIDDLPQATLDSQGPYSSQVRYDASQLSGAIGDTFKMGGIGLSGKDSTITLNDGQIVVNDTSANNSIVLSGSQTDYKNSNGNVVVREGILPDNSVGFRLEDNKGIGVAQFSRDINGVTTLRVAQANLEVSNATNDQLIFNSSQNIFKIVKKVPISLTYSHTATASEYHQTSVAHGLTYTPAFAAFHVIDPGMITYWSLSPAVGSRPNPSSLVGASGGFVISLCYAEVTVDATNVYLMVQTGGVEPTASYTFSATAYLLQETQT